MSKCFFYLSEHLASNPGKNKFHRRGKWCVPLFALNRRWRRSGRKPPWSNTEEVFSYACHFYVQSIHIHSLHPSIYFITRAAFVSLVIQALGWIGSRRFVFFPAPHLVLFFACHSDTWNQDERVRAAHRWTWASISIGRKMTDESPSAWAVRAENLRPPSPACLWPRRWLRLIRWGVSVWFPTESSNLPLIWPNWTRFAVAELPGLRGECGKRGLFFFFFWRRGDMKRGGMKRVGRN